MVRAVTLAATCIMMCAYQPAAQAAPRLCNPSQVAVVETALAKAKQGMAQAIQSIDRAGQADIDRYTTWFGAPSSANVASVRRTLERASAFSMFQLYYCPLTSTNEVAWDPGDIAQVKGQGEDITSIFLHEDFFGLLPSKETKQYGVIVHELTHFRMTGNTDDVDKSYTKAACKALATSDPTKARRNASNYHFFVQSFFND